MRWGGCLATHRGDLSGRKFFRQLPMSLLCAAVVKRRKRLFKRSLRIFCRRHECGICLLCELVLRAFMSLSTGPFLGQVCVLQRAATRCNTVQYTAAQTATDCNALQHTGSAHRANSSSACLRLDHGAFPQADVCVCMDVTHAHSHAYLPTHVYMCIDSCVCACVCMYMNVYKPHKRVCIRMYTTHKSTHILDLPPPTHTHTYTHPRTHTCPEWQMRSNVS